MPTMIDMGTPRLSDEIDCGGVECVGRLGDGDVVGDPPGVLDPAPDPAERLVVRVVGG